MTGLFSRSNEFVVLMRVFHHDKWPFSIPFDYFNIFLHFGFSGKKNRNSIYEDKIERNFVKRTANALYGIYFELFSSNHFKRFDVPFIHGTKKKFAWHFACESKSVRKKVTLIFNLCLLLFTFVGLASLSFYRYSSVIPLCTFIVRPYKVHMVCYIKL